MDITVYLPDDIGAWAKEQKVNLSAMLRGVLEEEIANQPADPLRKPFTQNIEEYLDWLEDQTGPFGDLDPHQLAGWAIQQYPRYQASPERKAIRAARQRKPRAS
jgi:hypothetical protein